MMHVDISASGSESSSDSNEKWIPIQYLRKHNLSIGIHFSYFLSATGWGLLKLLILVVCAQGLGPRGPGSEFQIIIPGAVTKGK